MISGNGAIHLYIIECLNSASKREFALKLTVFYFTGIGNSVSNYGNVTLTLRNNSQISGFKITNPRPYDSQRLSVTVLLNTINSARVHQNTIEGVMGGHGILMGTNSFDAAHQGGNVISGNSILF
ncbi:PF07602 domain protein [Leptospira alexanderi serovar Manhao 3 str. L 60]|uniref:PF07602 domain protein n=1 Tax=Leptospira alexanderi serovar Manhao 3 str. L 60 TaxID=1049759 RepID=V6I8G0_9LEPT|nr:PF07602 domain protein [Leptospira alexanderi serovar Manhao 3 str. L 60]